MHDVRPHMNALYEEPHVLATYLWHNYAFLFDGTDRMVMKALIGEAKASGAESPALAQRIREVFGSRNAASVSARLADGEVEFQRRACERLLAAHPTEVMINRCPKCSRIVRTPKAHQCLWCGHAWHAV